MCSSDLAVHVGDRVLAVNGFAIPDRPDDADRKVAAAVREMDRRARNSHVTCKHCKHYKLASRERGIVPLIPKRSTGRAGRMCRARRNPTRPD